MKFKAFLLLFLLSFIKLSAQKPLNSIDQKELWKTELSGQKHLTEGLSGAYFGSYKGVYLLAGGSLFPDAKPWQGGVKKFSQRVFVLDFSKTPSLVYQGDDLPLALAEGGFTTTGLGVVCIGGQHSEGLSKNAFILKYESGKILVETLPDLPLERKATAVTSIGNTLYVIGGQLKDGSSTNEVLKLDLVKKDKWESLSSYPVNISGATAVAQQDGKTTSVFVFGGRNLKSGNTKTEFYSAVFQYDTSKNSWIKKQDIQAEGKVQPLAVASGVKMGASSIVLLGGDTGQIYNQVEEAMAINDTLKRNLLWKNHTGFNSDILVYNTITDSWHTNSALQSPVAVGSAISIETSKESKILLFGGEKTPGVRFGGLQEISFKKATNFGWLNYSVLVVYFLAMLWVGFYFMKKNNNTEDYFKGGGRIPWWAAGISIFATMLSAITFISIPAKTYATNWTMLIFNMTIIMAVPFIVRYFLPFFLKFNFDTAYHYLEARFNRPVRWIAGTLFVLFMVSRIAIVLYLPSIALNAVTGFNVYYSILLMSLVTIIYSSTGGMEAVVWGDVIQGFILIGGAILAFVMMIIGIEGGFSEFFSTAIKFEKFKTFDFSLNLTQTTFWVVLLGGFANTMISYTSDQSVIQRYMTTTNPKATAKSIWLNGFISIPVSILFFLLGTGLFVFYKSNAGLIDITNPKIDSVFPQFIVSEMPMGLAGLLIAAIFAAAMSTISSNVNSVSAVITSDFFKTIFKNTSFKADMRVAQWSGVVVGLLGTAMAIVLATWDIASLWDQFNTFLGLLTGVLGALFILGIFFKRVSSLSAIIGLVSGILILYWVQNNTNLSSLLYGFIGMISCILVAFLVSFIFPNKKDVDELSW